eukprot:5602074-Pleurochrysis_carterae.AAC.1
MEGAGSSRTMAAWGPLGQGGGIDNRKPTAARPRRLGCFAGASSQYDPRSVALQRQRHKKPKGRRERAHAPAWLKGEGAPAR